MANTFYESKMKGSTPSSSISTVFYKSCKKINDIGGETWLKNFTLSNKSSILTFEVRGS